MTKTTKQRISAWIGISLCFWAASILGEAGGYTVYRIATDRTVDTIPHMVGVFSYRLLIGIPLSLVMGLWLIRRLYRAS